MTDRECEMVEKVIEKLCGEKQVGLVAVPEPQKPLRTEAESKVLAKLRKIAEWRKTSGRLAGRNLVLGPSVEYNLTDGDLCTLLDGGATCQ